MLRRLSIMILAATLLTNSFVAQAGRIPKRKIRRMFKHLAIVNDHFTGFMLYDLDKGRSIFELNSNKYFTPASNTKLFTFYTCLNMLGDSIPGIKYSIEGDSLLFSGTGDPSFLHADLKGNNAFSFLKQQNKQLLFCTGNYQKEIFGAGWAWDDYNDYYQAEINNLPLYGNTVYFSADSSRNLSVTPAFFRSLLLRDTASKQSTFSIKRDLVSNRFYFLGAKPSSKYHQWVPFKTSDELTVKLLADTLKKPVYLSHMTLPANAKIIYNIKADSVYKLMLQTSDNFVAEQLLLVCSSVKYGYLNTDSVRQYAIDSLLNDLPDKPQWRDGSGLSRQNLFTPRSIIALLQKISAKVNDEKKLFGMLPNGGVSGTLRTAYNTDNGEPFVFAKTGSLSNNYNQSGYLVTRKGHRLAFSFMNNNYTDATHAVRDEMVRIMTLIHEKF
ncbi:D-alanyl-D-alanine carboxypeptidase/D-alanyl-D-alanine-endopeptidase [Mucilaginibacter ginkgonis]|uniref:D-alanyl-D-alanine carboxypeptidase n=1 Tax=Mucilaginibacter ginkgonis TaxID=2682091 RepID=A0A6I4HZ26_9SPHI|nr:D-alanyl-D-alanine carboxypeptidase [Mucilaginibacter ginkgonis]QQL49764.1 D-alanyl-D-alanine carboxypeptidase [Mucilaginibacter ginkgonis]